MKRAFCCGDPVRVIGMGKRSKGTFCAARSDDMALYRSNFNGGEYLVPIAKVRRAAKTY